MVYYIVFIEPHRQTQQVLPYIRMEATKKQQGVG